jgi:SAM-dependent methyltransferase
MRTLEVASGVGLQLQKLVQNGCQAWGLDASPDLARESRERAGGRGVPVVCAIAEELPFLDRSFDSIICQGSLDHFADPHRFLSEVARVLKPEGRAIIVISNFDSLSCRLGRALFALRKAFRRPVYEGRNYWDIPDNHTFRGTNRVLRELCEPHLKMVECRGISLLWLFNRWTRLMEVLPESIAWTLMRASDKIAYRLPGLADMIISVWRPRSGVSGSR